MSKTRIVHEPGECFDPSYGSDCDGVATYTLDPYVLEIFDEEEWGWFCDGVLSGRAADV